MIKKGKMKINTIVLINVDVLEFFFLFRGKKKDCLFSKNKLNLKKVDEVCRFCCCLQHGNLFPVLKH